ncbi:MAG TPA: hypothetical protein VKD70_04140 [Candidatus Acidoferrum sp.]|nr:hypothetical protein [Candidatus Acidoferrum sp.]
MPSDKKRVAVIAIHGVGHHESGATAQAVTDLLAGVETGAIAHPRNRYTSFSLQQVQIPLPPAANPYRDLDSSCCSKPDPNGNHKWRLRAIFDERRGEFQTYYKWHAWFKRAGESDEHAEERKESARKLDIATEFMNVQIQEFAGDQPENSYTTWRHDGHRLRTDRTPEKEVHVYEMYWADLARPNNSLLRFLFSFYQLLLHLVSLGRLALDHASLENLGKLDWFLYLRTYTYAARVLSLAALPLLVLIYGVALAPLPLLIPSNAVRAVIGGGVVVFAGLFAVLFASLRSKPWLGAGSWWLWLLPSILPGSVLIWYLLKNPDFAPFVLVVEWWIVGALVCYWVFLEYDQVRNGAKQAGTFFIGLVTIAFFVILFAQGGHDEIALKSASILLVQYVFLLLRLLIFLFIFLVGLSFFLEVVCMLRLASQKENRAELARARAAGRTARFAMAIPALLILLLAVFTGSAAYRFMDRYGDPYEAAVVKPVLLPHFARSLALSPEDNRTLVYRIRIYSGKENPPSQNPQPATVPATPHVPIHAAHRILEGLIIQAAPPGMIFTLVLSAAGFVLLGLIVLPSVYFEIFPARSAFNGPARMLGNWLSAGFRSFRWSVTLIWVAIFAVPLLSIAFAVWSYCSDSMQESFLLYFYSLPWMAEGEAQLLTAGGLIAGSAVLLAGLLVKYLSAVLDTILDVDTYLRTTPVNATPRAMIAERYVSLLRHIHMCKEPDGSRSYDHLVIVAHSLGSLITADLLRFLNSGCMPEAARYAFAGPIEEALPIEFLSMGCPLRQLLNRFFPHLYRWISEVPEDTGFRAKPTQPEATIPAGSHPQPAQLLLRRWVNFYRSGDYVGRSIWTHEIFGRTTGPDDSGSYPNPAVPSIFHDGASTGVVQRVDSCIGLGAHTHYWDRSAPDVSTQLDILVAS